MIQHIATEAPAGMITSVGQRFVNADGETVLITGRARWTTMFPWSGTLLYGGRRDFDDAGRCSIGAQYPEQNLVSELPDELAEAKAEAQRQHDRVKELLGSRLSAEKFAKLLNDSETVDAIEEHDIEKRLIKLVGENYHRPDDGDDGHFVGDYLGAGRGYSQYDTLKVAVHLPKAIPFSVGCGTGMIEFVARRIDSEDGSAVIYEVERT